MVRFKNRYLLFEIVYADTPLGWTSIPASTSLALPNATQPGEAADQSPFGDTGRNNYRLPPLANKDLLFALKDSIAENFGDYGAGLTQRPLTCEYPLEEMHIVWGALTFINQLKGRPCIIKVIHTSGTIKKCQLTTIKYDRDRIMFLRNQAQLLKDSQAYTQLGLAYKESADEVNSLEI
ncbi:hypothetical protein KI688_004988 [Linnemannia hyalina]|uniref:Ribonuclease P/MRP protein subunit POP5 n=1 Tax=Linnemannia hyalina TaxID=64524 RepID=A0A9P7XM78_9FUNG|nr:hypothetical protein KI688_004988 [Linnemannia hyalina]